MKFIYPFIFLLSTIFNSNCQKTPPETIGFLMINISHIYHNGGQLMIFNIDEELLIKFHDKDIYINNAKYDLIEDEHLYKANVKAEVYFPEYGLFVLKCFKKSDKFYEAELNNEKVLISIHSNQVVFNDFKQFILNTYPVPTESNPLRVKPDDNATQVDNYLNYTFVPEKVVGDWVQVSDDKECYNGEYPSPVDIKGWIRWRKDGFFILKVAHTC